MCVCVWTEGQTIRFYSIYFGILGLCHNKLEREPFDNCIFTLMIECRVYKELIELILGLSLIDRELYTKIIIFLPMNSTSNDTIMSSTSHRYRV